MILSVIAQYMSCFAEKGEKKQANQEAIDGIYEITTIIDTDKKLHVIPGTENEIGIYSEKNGPRQKFYIKYNEISEDYTIKSLYSGTYLGVRKGDEVTAAKISLNAYGEEYYQNWSIKNVKGRLFIGLKTDKGDLMGLSEDETSDKLEDGSQIKFTVAKKLIQLMCLVPEQRLATKIYEITSPKLCQKRYSVLDAATVEPETGVELGAFLRNGYATQKFYIERQGRFNEYTIKSINPNLFIGVQNTQEGQAEIVCRETIEKLEDNLWIITQEDDGYYKIRSKANNLFFELGETSMLGKTSLSLRPEQDKPGQKFVFNDLIDQKDELCQIFSMVDENKIITINEDDLSKKTKLLTKPETFEMSQCFIFALDKLDGCYAIVNPSNGNCLSVDDSEPQSGMQIVQNPYSNKDHQKWIPLKFKNKKGTFFGFTLKSSVNSKPLSMCLHDDSAQEGNFLELTDKKINENSKAQLFKLNKLELESVTTKERRIYWENLRDIAVIKRDFLKKQQVEAQQSLTVEKEPDQTSEPPKIESSVEEEKASETEIEKNLDEGLKAKDLVNVSAKFSKYVPYVKEIEKNIDDPDFKPDNSIMQSREANLETVSKKLSYICNKILREPSQKALKPRPVQILAVLKLVESVLFPGEDIKGAVGNIRTGEGKSFIVALTAIVLQSYGQKIDIITSNMELVARDWEEQKFYYDLFGISSGFLYDRANDKAFFRRENDPNFNPDRIYDDEDAYNRDVLDRSIVYSTHANFQWLYLKKLPLENTMRQATAIVDEADNALIDESSNPAILSDGFRVDKESEILKCVYESVKSGNDLVKTIEILKREMPGEKFDEDNVGILVKAAQKALESKRDDDYIVNDEKHPATHECVKRVQIMDKSTGFVQKHSRWSAYIHEMIEIKEGLTVQGHGVTRCAVSSVVYFNAYEHIIGVTGSAGDDRDVDLYRKLYKLSTFDIPTNFEIDRDVILKVYNEKENLSDLIAKEAQQESQRGRPVLIIMESVNATNEMKSHYLRTANLIQGIDPRTDAKSIHEAGKTGTITISTIAAGRGTNILLDRKSLKAGGLHVIVAHLPQQSRTLIQNIGRSSRQGQAGSATVYLKYAEGFQSQKPVDKNTVNLFKLQEKFLEDLLNFWPWMLSMKKMYHGSASYKFGATTDDILYKNAQFIADTFFWPSKTLSDLEFTEYINMVYDMVFVAWGDMYTRLSRTKDSENWDYCLQKYNEMMKKIFEWIPQNCKEPGELLKNFAHRTGVEQKIFDLLYTHGENETVHDFVSRLIHLRKVQQHALAAGVNIHSFSAMLKFLPPEHQKAYAKYCHAVEEYNCKVEKYKRDYQAYQIREAERKYIAQMNGKLYNRIEEERSCAESQIRDQNAKAAKQQKCEEKTPERLPKQQPKTSSKSCSSGGFSLFGTTVHACEANGSEEPKRSQEPKKGFFEGLCDAGKAAIETVGEVAVSLVSLALSPFEQTAHAPGPPEGIWTYGDVLEHLPTEAEIRSALEYRAKEYEKQMRVLPDSLPLPVFPAKPDWKNIGWEAFDGANLLNCILSRINPFYLDQYANSSYRNPSQILTERAHNLKLVRETELDRLAHEISEKVQPKKPSIDWKLIGRVTLIVGGIAILTCVNAMSGGSLTPLQMALIAGATGAVVDGGGEIISNLSDGEPVNWGAVAARTAGGGAKGAIFSIPGLGFAKTTASVMGVAAAENYAYNRANGVDPQEALGNAVANGVVEGTVAGLIDQGAKKLVGMCAKPKPEPKLSHPSPKPLPEPELQPLSEAELEKVVGGAKDPNWRPGGTASCEKPKVPDSKSKPEVKTQPKVIKVTNMKEFFETDFGKTLKAKSRKTHYQQGPITAYELTEKVGNPHLNKGDLYYLDFKHGDHIEVFNHRGKVKYVLNLDGTINEAKTAKALREARTIEI